MMHEHTNSEAGTGAEGRRVRRLARRYLYPPSGRQVRRLAAVLSLAVGVPRLQLVGDVFAFAPQRFGPPELFGVLCTLVGILLLATAYERRLRISGRLVAVVGFATWVTLAAATTSATSLLVDLAVAASLLMEAGTLRDE